ncbi:MULTISPECIES: helix-turn-helix transcriptional regulator [unclassified Sinorhizobium]|uniref:helix-turn-helix transcriptional regulator n=1 Tax=unclassified Sinorhizobium TaxID=2613772 RepID=UPI003524D0E6
MMSNQAIPLECPLTKRQIECVEWASRGKTAFETGIILGITHYCVERHIKDATAAAGVTNKTAVVAAALRNGWIE